MIYIDENMERYISTGKPVPELRAIGEEAAGEGIVLLRNFGALPLEGEFALFGRMQNHYLKCGTGSGGNVNCESVIGIRDALAELGYRADERISELYDSFVAENPYDNGNGWWQPWSQKEFIPAEDEIAAAGQRCPTAVYVITRTAGEDRDASPEKGSYYLSDDEEKLLTLLRLCFEKVVLLFNICAVMDFSAISRFSDAALVLWQGGMDGARAAAKAITGIINPSGKLPDTVPTTLEGYPASGFGNDGNVVYDEDIYVGYRYFTTFAPEKIAYPFGFGLSYTKFTTEFAGADGFDFTFEVKNIGDMSGKEVVQLYIEPPQGRLGKPLRVLCGFAKTELLAPGESCRVTIGIQEDDIASYDETVGYVIEKGEYGVFSLGDSASCVKVAEFAVDEDKIIQKSLPVMGANIGYEKLVNQGGSPVRVAVEASPCTECFKAKDTARYDGSVTLDDVAEGRNTLDELIGTLSDTELCCLVRGEGMSSPKGTPGAASVFGGVIELLRSKKIPIMCCTDGPSGVRLSSTAKATALPDCTAIAATFNLPLAEKLFRFEGYELCAHDSDLLLGPGVNIHRSPLCGRNFEYFSEDPFLAGSFAAAISRGLNSAGVGAVVKHFMANNQEAHRHSYNAVISERAVREIYAKPFEMAVRRGNVKSVMTSYNRINGSYAATNIGLCALLRDVFGFEGLVMTDWWAKLTGDDGQACVTNLRGMVKAQNDVYMVTPDALTREDNLASSLADGSLERAELCRSARHILAFALESLTYARVRKYGEKQSADLRAAAEGALPAALLNFEGECAFKTDIAEQYIIRATVEYSTEGAEQATVKLLINTKNAAEFTVGGGVTVDFRVAALLAGENKFEFVSNSPDARIKELALFKL